MTRTATWHGRLAGLDAMAGTLIGDPDRAADAIIQLVNAAEPPVHLLLGSDTLARARAASIPRWLKSTIAIR